MRYNSSQGLDWHSRQMNQTPSVNNDAITNFPQLSVKSHLDEPPTLEETASDIGAIMKGKSCGPWWYSCRSTKGCWPSSHWETGCSLFANLGPVGHSQWSSRCFDCYHFQERWQDKLWKRDLLDTGMTTCLHRYLLIAGLPKVLKWRLESSRDVSWHQHSSRFSSPPCYTSCRRNYPVV